MFMGKCVNSFVLTEEQRKLIEENHNLIYDYMVKHKLDFSDYYDLLAIALCKAAIHYNFESSAFSTFAFACFRNACLVEHTSKNRQLKRSNGEIMSLNYEYSFSEDGSSCCLQDCLVDDFDMEESICNKIDFENMSNVINKILTEQERYIVYSLFISKKTLQTIGDEFGITRERVRQIKAKAIEKIKQKFNTD